MRKCIENIKEYEEICGKYEEMRGKYEGIHMWKILNMEKYYEGIWKNTWKVWRNRKKYVKNMEECEEICGKYEEIRRKYEGASLGSRIWKNFELSSSV